MTIFYFQKRSVRTKRHALTTSLFTAILFLLLTLLSFNNLYATENQDTIPPDIFLVDVLGNELMSIDTFQLPEGECYYWQTFLLWTVDDCDGFITGNMAILANVEMIPETLIPVSQISLDNNGEGFFQFCARFAVGTTQVTFHAEDSEGNISEKSIEIVVESNGTAAITFTIEDPIQVSACADTRVIRLNLKVEGVCESDLNNGHLEFTANGTEELIWEDVSYEGEYYNANYYYKANYEVTLNLADDASVWTANFKKFNGEVIGTATQIIHIEEVPEDAPPIIIASDVMITYPYCKDDILFCYSFEICDFCEPIVENVVDFDSDGTGLAINFVDAIGETNCVFFEACGIVEAGTYNYIITYDGETVEKTITIEQVPNEPAEIIIPYDLNFVIPTCISELTTTLAVRVIDDCGIAHDSLEVSLCGYTIVPTFANEPAGYFEYTPTIDIEDDGKLLKIRYIDEAGDTTIICDTIHVSAFPDVAPPILVYSAEDINIAVNACEATATIAFFDMYAIDNCDGDLPVNLVLSTTEGDTITGATFFDIGGPTMGLVLATNTDYIVSASVADALGNVTTGEFQILINQDDIAAVDLLCNEDLTVTLVDTNSIRLTPSMILSGEWGCLTDNDFEVVLLGENDDYLRGCGEYSYELYQLGTQNTGGLNESFAPEYWTVLEDTSDNARVFFSDTTLRIETFGSGDFDDDNFDFDGIDVMAMLPIVEAGTFSFDYTFTGYGDNWGWFIIHENGTVVEQLSAGTGEGTVSQLLAAGDVILFGIDDNGFNPFEGPFSSILLLENLLFTPTEDVPSELFCSGTVTTMGNVAPVLACQGDTAVYTVGPFDCTATFVLQLPIITSTCGDYEIKADVYMIDPEVPVYNEFNQLIGYEEALVLVEEGLAIGSYVVNIVYGGFIRYYAFTGGDTTFIDCPFIIVDEYAPKEACNDDFNFLIGEEGITRLYADDLNDWSYDNCTNDIRIEIQVEGDTTWSEYIDIDCTQVGEYLTVKLRVWDDANEDGIVGNTGDLSSTCSTEILVQDLINPICTAPEFMAISCADIATLNVDWADTDSLNDLFGEATATDNCTATATQTDITLNLSDCGWGTVVRTFIATDASGATSTTLCQQVINIQEMHDYEIKFPKDYTGYTCGEALADTLAYSANACDLFTVNVSIENFGALGPECSRLLHTYRLINWCEWDGETDPVVIGRDEDCDGVPGDEDVWVLLRSAPLGTLPAFVTYLDRNNDENSNPYIGNNRCGTGTGTLPSGHWSNSINNPEITSVGYWQYTQVIKIFDDEVPQVETTEYDVFCSTNADCTGEVDLTFVVTEICFTKEVYAEGSVDLDSDGIDDEEMVIEAGVVDGNTKTFTISGAYPVGTHIFNISVEDACHNEIAFELPFEVVDCAPPIFECTALEIITLSQQPDGCCGAAIWAIDFVETANTDCSIPFVFSIHRAEGVENGSDMPNAEQIGIVLDCNDPSLVLIRIYAWDDAYNPYAVQPDGSVGGANYDYCEVPLLIQDPSCLNGTNNILSGVIFTEEDEAIQGIEVNLTGSAMGNGLTNDTGQFQLVSNDIQEGNEYTITPYSNTLPENALSTFDMILISKHILGTQLLDSPYKIIAADINASGSVTNIDVIQLRKLLLGEYDEYPNNTFWRFVDADYNFPDPTNPWVEVFPEIIELTYSNLTVFDNDFIGVAIGDVNGSAVTNLVGDNLEERAVEDIFVLNTADIALKKGNTYRVTFTANDFEKIMGYQFTLAFDQNILDFQTIDYGVAQANNFGMHYLEEGLITTSWNTFTGKKTENDELFTLVFQAKTTAQLREAIAINSNITKAEAYDNTGQLSVELNIQDSEIAKNNIELYQNQPNPFANETLISFNLPIDEKIQLTIQDVTGKILQTFTKEGKKGNNSISIDAKTLGTTGILFYTLSTENFTATKRMLLIE